MAVQILAGMADFIRAGAGRSEGMILFIFMEEEGGIVTAQDSCDMRDRLLRYFATCGQEKPLSGNLKRGEKTPENG